MRSVIEPDRLGWRRSLRRHDVLLFVLVTFTLTWAVWVPRAMGTEVGIVGQLWTWAPAVAAVAWALAARSYEEKIRAGTFKPAFAVNCAVDANLEPAPRAHPRGARPSDWIISGLILGEVALVAYAKLRARFKNVRG